MTSITIDIETGLWIIQRIKNEACFGDDRPVSLRQIMKPAIIPIRPPITINRSEPLESVEDSPLV